MVPALLYLLFRKYLAKHWPRLRVKLASIPVTKNFLLLFAFIVLLLLKLSSLKAQEKQLDYEVVRNGKVIGWTKLVKTTTDQQVGIKLNSEVKTRFVFQFVAKAMEEVVFNNGQLVYTSQFTKLNGDVKEDKSMRWTARGYEVYKGKDTQPLSFSLLHAHMLGLYFEEPRQGEKIYSDRFQQLLDVHKIAGGGYRINLPDGGSCTYYYQHGVCTEVKIDQRLYSAEMRLHQQNKL
jgi:hypothetical protein